MRIAAVTNFLTVYGGAEVFLRNVLDRLGGRHAVTLFALDGNPEVTGRFSGIVEDVRTYGFSYGKAFPKPFFWLNPMVHLLGMNVSSAEKAMERMARDINSGGYDAVLAQQAHITPLGFPYIDTPIVFYCHEPPRHIYDDTLRGELKKWKRSRGPLAVVMEYFLEAENRYFREAYERSVKEASVVLANSRYTASTIKRAWGVNARVVYPGVDYRVFRPDGKMGVRGVDGPYILSVGSLMAHKGPMTAVEAVGASGLDLPLVFVGSSTDVIPRNAVEDRAADLGVEVVIVDGLSDEELAAAYRGASAVLCTNIMEPFGLVPIEAVACGTPVVAVNEGGFRETIGECGGGVLVDREDSALGRALKRTVDSPPDMGDAVKCMSKRFNWNKTAEAIESALEEVA